MAKRVSVYNEAAKEATMRYMEAHRDTLKLNFPKGTKERYRQYAKECRGISLTALIMELIEDDIQRNGWVEKKAEE